MGTEATTWERLEALFDAALRLGAAERAAYLARACGDDERLHREVTALLAAFEKQAAFLEQPALNRGLKVLAAGDETSLTGQTIGSYKLLRMLGRGGMGEVYLAEDTRLKRQVALKFLAPRLVGDQWAKRQLTKEAQAVARLDHPNICTVHDLEEADGHSFIVMQYIEGESLAQLLQERHPSVADARQALPLALQMVGALAAAHAHDIIHRDVKPQNIMVTPDGHLKVLDFGLAKLVQGKQEGVATGEALSQVSQTGLVVGTIAYMSPEQLRGEKLDFRTDIFSLGMVLHELMSGMHPFAQASDAETIAAILTGCPTAPCANGLGRIIGKCLEKNKERRYDSASALLLDLQSVASGGVTRSVRVRRQPWLIMLLCLLVVVGATLIYRHLTSVPTLAILPFVNASSDAQADYLCAGLTAVFSDKLSRLPALQVKAPSVVTPDRNGPADPLFVARTLGAQTVLVGEVTQPRDALMRQAVLRLETVRERASPVANNGPDAPARLLRLRLLNTSDGRQLWAESYDLGQTDISALPELAAAAIIAKLQLRLSSVEQKLLATRPTTNREAFLHYLRGRHYWNKRDPENIRLAIKSFQQAKDIDPTFALAHVGLADSYVVLSTVAYGSVSTKEAMPMARAAANSALEIDDSLCEAHTSLGVVKLRYDWNWAEAEASFQRAIALNYNYAPAHYWYANLLAVTGRTAQAVAESEIAKDLEPFSPLVDMNLGRALYFARQYDRAAAHFLKTLQRDPDDAGALYMLGFIYAQKRMHTEALATLRRLYGQEKHRLLAAAPLGYLHGKLGQRDEANRLLQELDTLAQGRHLPPLEKALIHLGLGNKEQTFVWLEKACEERFASLIYLMVDPLFDELRADPRFAALAKRINP